MLITVLIWVVLFTVFYLYGSFLLCIFCKFDKNFTTELNWTGKILLGMGVCTALALWFSLFMPLKILPPLITIAGAIVCIPVLIRHRALGFPQLSTDGFHFRDLLISVLAVIIFLFIFFNSQAQPANPDTSLYHAQTIHWIEDFPVIPGLGHLHSRLAFNSGWLVLNALFTFSFINDVSNHVLPGFVMLIAMLELLQSIRRMIKGNVCLSGVFSTVMIPLIFVVNASEISSPGTDMPGLLAAALTALYVIRYFESEEKSRAYLLLILMLVFWSVTVKLSAIALLFFIVILFLFSKKKRKWMIQTCALMLGLLWIPWLIRSVVMTGYLIYPEAFPDVFNFDWKISLERIQSEMKSIRAWAFLPRMDADKAMSVPLITRYKMWLANLSLNRQILIAAAVFSPFPAGILCIFSGKIWKRLNENGFWFSVMPFYAGIWYWLLSAPDIRFGYMYILPTAALGLGGIILIAQHLLNQQKVVKNLFVLIEAIVLVFISLMFFRSLDAADLNTHLLFPAEYPKRPTEPCSFGNFSVFCAQSYSECWYEPFPCVPKANSSVMMRGGTFRDGFYSTR